MFRFMRQAYLSYKSLYSYMDPKIYILMMIVNPSLQLIYFSFMVKFAYGSSDISPWIIGNAFLLASSNCIFVVGSLVRSERNQGTLQYIVAAPANNFKVFIARSLFHLIDILIRIIIGFAIGIVFFNFKIWELNLSKLALTLLTGMLSGMGFGLLIGSISMISTDVHLFLNTMEQILIVFTGALFPLSKLPVWLQWLPNCLPLTRSIKAAQMLLVSNQAHFFTLIFEEILLAFFLIFSGYFMFEWMQFKAKKIGNLDLY